MKEQQSFFSQQQDRFRYIAGIQPSSEDLALYRAVLTSRDVLVPVSLPSFTSSEGLCSRFEYSFRKNYAAMLGKDTLDRFFSSFTTDNVFVLKKQAYEKVLSDWLGYEDGVGSRAVYHPDGHIIFVKEAPTTSTLPASTYIEARLLEEALHEFLDSEVAGGKLHNMLKRFHLSQERRSALHADFYADIPEEQMVKAMKLSIAKDMFDYPLEDLFPFTDFLAADEGEKRIQLLGKEKILQGRWSR